MNSLCTICDAVVAGREAPGRCPECGARGQFLIATLQPRRPSRPLGVDSVRAWEFGPDGPVLVRIR